mmetsp:Transcript_1086/g.1706  ORF Transcript_1086/g.1706 Transcript_1086/m.1706 type:complete len:549 (+) Transcript_1086:976-2622(+)
MNSCWVAVVLLVPARRGARKIQIRMTIVVQMMVIKKKKKKEKKEKIPPKEEEEEEAEEEQMVAAAAEESEPKQAGSSSSEEDDNEEEDEDETAGEVLSKSTFASLGINEELCKAVQRLNWTTATQIQANAIPTALEGRDIIGLAETGSGKTGAFTLPILQRLMQEPSKLFAVILAPTRELAFQIHEVVRALGNSVGCTSLCITGGVDNTQQAIALARMPHIVVATPGRLVDHLENTKGFSLAKLKYLVLDEADRMLSMDFEEEIDKILDVIPDYDGGRRTMLFSATMTSKVQKLQRASLHDPVKVEVQRHKFQTPKKLIQNYLFIPAKYKDCYFTYLINELSGQSVLVFVATCNNAQRLALMLRNLGFSAVCLHGQMSQPKRLGALHKFKSGGRDILICTDVASRGLDIPSVDCVINFDLPGHGKDYIHRVGRTARAGRSGKAIAMVTQYDVEVYQRIEALLGTKLPSYDLDEETVLLLLERVSEAQRLATRELKESLAAQTGGRRGKRGKKDRGMDIEGLEDTLRSEAKERYASGGGGNRKKKHRRK